MKIKQFGIPIIIIIFITIITVIFIDFSKPVFSATEQVQTVTVKPTKSQILASGSIQSVNQTDLHFQIGGELVSLVAKEGDQVKQGQVIASLDTRDLEAALREANQTYAAKNATAQRAEDDVKGHDTDESFTQKEERVIAQSAQNVAYDQVKQAQLDLEKAVLLAPVDGTIVHEDVDQVGVNVTPVTTFTIADTKNLVFKAQVSDSDVNYIHQGDQAQIQLDGLSNTNITGTVSKIYPEKIQLVNGGSGYNVDIASDQLNQISQYGATGSVLIANSNTNNALMVPAWSVLNNQSIWVVNNNQFQLKQIKVGQIQGDQIQVLSGLSIGDQVVANPQIIVKKEYLVI